MQKQELETSKRKLESHLGGRVRSLAYPVGGPYTFTEDTKALARAAGYEAAFSFYGGVNDDRIVDAFAICRMPVPDQLSVYKATVTMPSMFA